MDVTRRLSTESSYAILLEGFRRQAPLCAANNREWTEDDSRWTQDDLSFVLRNYRLLQTLGIHSCLVCTSAVDTEYNEVLTFS